MGRGRERGRHLFEIDTTKKEEEEEEEEEPLKVSSSPPLPPSIVVFIATSTNFFSIFSHSRGGLALKSLSLSLSLFLAVK